MQTNPILSYKLFRNVTFAVLSLGLLISPLANAVSITEQMSSEVSTEFDKLLNLQPWPVMYKKLAFMDNPYGKFYKEIKAKLKAEAEPGKRRRLMTEEESTLKAKKTRFDYCQASVDFFIDFAQRAHSLSTLEDKPETKDQLMKGNGVAYPFTEQETNDAGYRPAQIALTLGWKYKGKGEAHAEDFLAACLAIPVSLYYKEDKI